MKKNFTRGHGERGEHGDKLKEFILYNFSVQLRELCASV